MDDTGNPAGAGYPEGHVPALKCPGTPQAATRTPMSRHRPLRNRVTAYRTRIRPRKHSRTRVTGPAHGKEIGTRKPMLDAALNAGAPDPASVFPLDSITPARRTSSQVQAPRRSPLVSRRARPESARSARKPAAPRSRLPLPGQLAGGQGQAGRSRSAKGPQPPGGQTPLPPGAADAAVTRRDSIVNVNRRSALVTTYGRRSRAALQIRAL
jgi:hypothetical protein